MAEVEPDRRCSNGGVAPLIGKPRETTMRTVGSTLAVMEIEEELLAGGTIRFLAEGVHFTMTREDLVGQ